LTDTLGSELFDFSVTGQGLDFLVGGIFPDGVIGAFADEQATVKVKV
jgi:hypothetical protein